MEYLKTGRPFFPEKIIFAQIWSKKAKMAIWFADNHRSLLKVDTIILVMYNKSKIPKVGLHIFVVYPEKHGL